MNTHDQPQHGHNPAHQAHSAGSSGMNSGKKSGKSFIPFLVVIIAVALIITARMVQHGSAVPQLSQEIRAVEMTVPEASAADHIRGDISAPVQIIEYSDLECPYCRTFHSTMLQIEKEYVQTGKVVWIYRHFPLTQIHPHARDLAIASECAANLGGNDAFWKMVDGIFGEAQGFDVTKLPTLAKNSGLNVSSFTRCYSAKETASKVDAQASEGAAAGANGTPYSIIVTKDGYKFPVSGAYPYAEMKTLIDAALAR